MAETTSGGVAPFPGCDVCAALFEQRREALRVGDAAMAADCGAELGRHRNQTQEQGSSPV
ncbi:hypothetical protein [Streptomyces sp. DW26H14]|uniref:hypothetical protein n=1 Tax=Streptomyces sp. DW26H14 TaxID=3435395 RepID=UPI00403D96A7